MLKDMMMSDIPLYGRKVTICKNEQSDFQEEAVGSEADNPEIIERKPEASKETGPAKSRKKKGDSRNRLPQQVPDQHAGVQSFPCLHKQGGDGLYQTVSACNSPRCQRIRISKQHIHGSYSIPLG